MDAERVLNKYILSKREEVIVCYSRKTMYIMLSKNTNASVLHSTRKLN